MSQNAPNENFRQLARKLSAFHILIADADTRVAALVRDIVKRLGFEKIQMVHDGAEAAQIMRTQPVDIVITDWQMHPVDGITFVKHLRDTSNHTHRKVAVIMLTGRGEKSDVETARDAGVTEFIVKPFQAKTLLDRLVMLVEHPRNFVISKDFKGPDRRRRVAMDGEERRKNKVQPKNFITRNEEEAIDADASIVHVLAPDYELKTKLGNDVDIRDILLPEIIRNVQLVIDEHKPHFLTWMDSDFDNLQQAYDRSRVSPQAAEAEMENIYNMAFAIKSQAGIFGYSLASAVAKLLYTFVEAAPRFDENYMLVVKQHIDALRGIFQLDVEGDGDKMGRELIASLQKLAAKYVSMLR